MSASQPTFVLVHGAFADGSCWHKVTPRLEAAGARVISGDLPGTNSDPSPPGTVTLDAYVQKVTGWIQSAGGPVVLVGHSMGGMVISQVSENVPNLISRAIYLSAYLPQNGESLLALSQADKDSQLGKFLTVNQQEGYGSVSDEGMRVAFFNGCSEADTEDGLKHNHKQPLQPFVTPVKLTADNFGKVPRYYVHTKQDRAVSYSLQQSMLANNPAKAVETIDAGHASFLSSDARVAQIFLAFANA